MFTTINEKLYRFAKSISDNETKDINKQFDNILSSNMNKTTHNIRRMYATFYIKLTEEQIDSLDLTPLYIPKIHKRIPIFDIILGRPFVRYVDFERCSNNILIINIKFES